MRSRDILVQVNRGSSYEPLAACQTGLVKSCVQCNRGTERAANLALQMQSANPGAAQRQWQAVYAAVDRDARLVANSTTLNIAAFESHRVGNTHFGPFAGVMFDQLWVH